MRDRLLRLGLALMVMTLVAGGLAGPAVAVGPDNGEPHVLTSAAPVAKALAGSEAGSFHYYIIHYPGGEADVRVRVTFEPQEPAVAAALGFNVYGPDGREHRGDWKADDGYLEVTYQREAAADLLVQVYNYSTRTVSYTITVVGLPEAVVPLVDIEPAEVEPVEADEVTVEEPLSGVVMGSLAGAFGEHTIIYEGSEKEVTVTMAFAPADPSFGEAFGLNVYGPSGERVASAAPTDDWAVRKATISTDVAGEYLLQVYNYTDGIPLHYWLEVSE